MVIITFYDSGPIRLVSLNSSFRRNFANQLNSETVALRRLLLTLTSSTYSLLTKKIIVSLVNSAARINLNFNAVVV